MQLYIYNDLVRKSAPHRNCASCDKGLFVKLTPTDPHQAQKHLCEGGTPHQFHQQYYANILGPSAQHCPVHPRRTIKFSITVQLYRYQHFIIAITRDNLVHHL